MVDWASLVLKSIYYYGHLIGLSNFDFDWKTGRAYTSKRSTFYAIFVGLMFPTLLVFHWAGRAQFKVIFRNANMLHEYVMVLMRVLRISAGLLTLLSQWLRRRQVMLLSRSLFRLYQERPEVKRMCRRGIMTKYCIAIAKDFTQVWISLDALDSNVNSSMLFGQFLVYSMTSIVNLAVTQHYFVLLFIRARYLLLNRELREVIDEANELSHRPPRRGVFICRCCSLADRVEAIASLQGKLQSMVQKIRDLYAIQGLLVFSGYYLSAVGTGYLGYTIVKYGLKDLGMSYRRLALIVCWCFFYYLDALLNLFVTFYFLEEHQKTIVLMEKRTLFAPGLDVRLEEAFESLQLQLIRNPLKLTVMKSIPMSRIATTSILGSILTNCIFLIQYDMEYF
ncbi:putative gustatory receptor 36c [Drosophila madeirensis]|uniref:Gustatory receptor n=1 Tax=Drosophila madeirensis TaxID=30013 RepID=A0AAU9FFV4_DROMD